MVLIETYAKLLVVELYDIAGNNFFALPGFNLPIDQHQARSDYLFCFPTTREQALKFKDFIELNRLARNFYISHAVEVYSWTFKF